MFSALDSGSSSLGSGPGQGHCVVFLGKGTFALSVESAVNIFILPLIIFAA